MKNRYFTWILSSLMAVFLYSCSAQNYLDKATLDTLLAQKQFTFMAEKAHPTNYDVINVMNSMPNSTATRILDLSYGYTVTLEDNKMEVTLPYFGRTYIPSTDPDKNSFRFTSKDYSITQKNGKNDAVIFIIKPNDIRHIEAIYMEINKNGGAYVSVNANDRQPISYSGYIMKNEVNKK